MVVVLDAPLAYVQSGSVTVRQAVQFFVDETVRASDVVIPCDLMDVIALRNAVKQASPPVDTPNLRFKFGTRVRRNVEEKFENVGEQTLASVKAWVGKAWHVCSRKQERLTINALNGTLSPQRSSSRRATGSAG